MDMKLISQYLVLVFSIIISGIVIHLSETLPMLIFGFSILPIVSILIVKVNISHPYVWYSTFFSLYALGYPILLLLEENNHNYEYGFSQQLFSLHWLALSVFLLVLTPKSYDLKDVKSKLDPNKFVYSNYLYWILTFIMLVFVFYLDSLNLSSKSELQDSNVIVNIGIRMSLVYILITSVELIKKIMNKDKVGFRKIMFSSSGVFLLITLASAERDILFRFLLVSFFVYYALIYTQKHFIRLLFILISMLLAIPISRSVKFLWMKGEYNNFESSMIVEIINSEFHTQARNVQLLLLNNIQPGLLEGKSFIYSINNLIGINGFSALKWFQDTFYLNHKTGMGFSLVGEGYMNSGYLGIVLIFLLIGKVVKDLYRKSTSNIYWFVGYLLIIPISAYSLRADLNNFLSQSIKQVLFVILIFGILDVFLKGRNRINENFKRA